MIFHSRAGIGAAHFFFWVSCREFSRNYIHMGNVAKQGEIIQAQRFLGPVISP